MRNKIQRIIQVTEASIISTGCWIGDNNYIPEQIFENDIQVSVSPLLWSHSMFVIASEELNFL